jgi:poly [ADP-ribose] polymerase
VKIEKGQMRIGVHIDNGQFEYVNWTHPACFTMPRKLNMGANAMTTQQFIEAHLEDTTGGEILPAKAEELATEIDKKVDLQKKGDDNHSGSPLDSIKQEYEQQQKDTDSGNEPLPKRTKSSSGKAVELYAKYKSLKVDELKDFLRWNRQVMTGTKDIVLFKAIDGNIYGRLARCVLCGGRLKMNSDCTKVICSGSFDEDTSMRIDCAYQVEVPEAPRWQPWYTEEPSEEEQEAMDKLESEASLDIPAPDPELDVDIGKLVKEAEKLEWKLTSKDGLRKAVAELTDVVQKHEGKSVDLPDDIGSAKMKVGEVIARNREKSAAELVPIIVQEFGFKESKVAKAAKKEAAMEIMVKEPKNLPLVAAFQELSELYFKEGNRNAGASYAKVVSALKELSYEVTEENAKGLGKGKTKVANIGKTSADRIFEFVCTGKMEKLIEKRADAS